MEMKVTVLMPVYNASMFLHEAIDSILNQTFREFEFLIIDDGSTDNTVEIIQSYTDPRIRLVKNEENKGISATLNRGIELSSCEVVARMDADDISYPQRLEKQYNYMMAHPECCLLSTWCKVITPGKRFVRMEHYPGKFYYYNLNFECWIYHPTVMFRKSAARAVGMYSMPFSEDYDFFWKMAQQFPIANLDEPLLDYRLSPTSLNSVLRKKEYEEANRQNVIRNLQRYMGKDFILPEAFLECLRHNFKPILALQDISEILRCLIVLDQITERILLAENINRKVDDIKKAAWHKRDFMVYEMAWQLPLSRMVSFLIKTNKPGVVFRKIQKALRWRIRAFMRQTASWRKTKLRPV